MGCNTSKEATQAAAESTSAIGSQLGNLAQGAETTLNNVVDKTKENVAEVVHKTRDNLTEVVEKGKESVAEVMEKGMENVEEMLEKGKGAVSEMVEQAQENVTEMLGMTKQDIADGVRRPDVSEIDLNDPEANRAATKIQAAFRGHQTRKNMKQGDAESKPNLKEEFNPDNKELCEAATKIQASFRGHLVRKSAKKDEEEELSRELKKLNAKATEEIDVDLSDPDLQLAATKIQASFRGHRVRKEKQADN